MTALALHGRVVASVPEAVDLPVPHAATPGSHSVAAVSYGPQLSPRRAALAAARTRIAATRVYVDSQDASGLLRLDDPHSGGALGPAPGAGRGSRGGAGSRSAAAATAAANASQPSAQRSSGEYDVPLDPAELALLKTTRSSASTFRRTADANAAGAAPRTGDEDSDGAAVFDVSEEAEDAAAAAESDAAALQQPQLQRPSIEAVEACGAAGGSLEVAVGLLKVRFGRRGMATIIL
jgi:hypothetical protein